MIQSMFQSHFPHQSLFSFTLHFTHARGSFIQGWSLLAPLFKRSQPWHALRAAACTASNIPSFLGLSSSSSSSVFDVFFGGWSPARESFAMKWGVQHESIGVASILRSFADISSSMASKMSIPVPSTVSVHEQGLLFVHHTNALLQGTVFAAPSGFSIAASPDAQLVGEGFCALLEVKCACPYIEKDDGTGWVWSPSLRANGVSVAHFV